MLTEDHGAAVAAAYGLGEGRLTGPVDRGWLGRVWRLETVSGTYAVKEPLVALDAAEAERTGSFQEAVAAAGVHVPPVLRTTDGALVAEVEGTPVRVYGWVDLAPTDRRLDPADVGRTVADLHAVVLPAWGPVEEWFGRPLGDGGWAELADRMARAGAPYAADLARLLPEQSRVEALLASVEPVQTCHLDLWSDNVRRAGDGGVCVFDFDNAGPGDPAGELGMLLVDFGCGEPDRMRRLYDAYRDAGGPAEVAGPETLTMVVATLGHITREACERWLAASDPGEREPLEAWAREYVDEPVTLALVDAILTACGAA